jgi:hypothetical protein
MVKRNEYGKVVNMVELSEVGNQMTIDRYIFGEIRAGEAE